MVAVEVVIIIVLVVVVKVLTVVGQQLKQKVIINLDGAAVNHKFYKVDIFNGISTTFYIVIK